MTSAISPDANYLPKLAVQGLHLSQDCCTTGCSEYHGLWGFARLYGVMPSVARWHEELLCAFKQAAERGAKRVLLCGSADQGLLAYLIGGYEIAGQTADVTVLDLCPTPLTLCKAYGVQRGWNVQTICGDATTTVTEPVDLIVAHNFHNFLSPEGRAALAKSWAASLAPGGEVLIFSKIRPETGPTQKRFEDGEALADALSAARATSDHADLIQEAPLRALATSFADRRTRFNVTSRADLEQPLMEAGLTTVSFETADRVEEGIESSGGGQRYVLRMRLEK